MNESTISKASIADFNDIKNITVQTIKEIYPAYYPKGAVDFFLAHHNDSMIEKDILNELVYILKAEDRITGTVTVSKNEIGRLFVLPQFQKKGYGSKLLEFAELLIGENHRYIQLDSSLPAKEMYVKHQYHAIESHTIHTPNGDALCYDVMQKNVVNKNLISYDGKIFIAQSNSENGEVSDQTVFHYHQNGHVLYADYMGGEILKGFIIGTVKDDCSLDFHYEHLNINNEIRIGKCHSIPTIQKDGRVLLHEEWQWLNHDRSKGLSTLIEIKKMV